MYTLYPFNYTSAFSIVPPSSCLIFAAQFKPIPSSWMALPLRPSYLQRDTTHHHLNRVKAHSSIYTYILEGVRDHHLPLHRLYITSITRRPPSPDSPLSMNISVDRRRYSIAFYVSSSLSLFINSTILWPHLIEFLTWRLLPSSQHRRQRNNNLVRCIFSFLRSFISISLVALGQVDDR